MTDDPLVDLWESERVYAARSFVLHLSLVATPAEMAQAIEATGDYALMEAFHEYVEEEKARSATP